MTTDGSRLTYGTTYSLLHWLIALCIISLFSMQYFRKLFDEDVQDVVREFHKSIGLIAIVLICVRLILRVVSEHPPKLSDPSRARSILAAIVHKGLWLLMILVPSLGVGFLLTRGRGVDFFMLAAFGPYTTGSPYWGSLTLTIHRYAAFVLVGLVTLHVGGALFHQLVLKDRIIARMLPFLGRPSIQNDT